MLPGAEAIAPLIKDVLINPANETSCLKVEAICVKLLDMMASRGFIRRTGSDFTAGLYRPAHGKDRRSSDKAHAPDGRLSCLNYERRKK